MFVWRLHYALLKGAFCYAEVEDQVRFKKPLASLPRSGFVQRQLWFGSAARRCTGENIISRYQMTVLVEALFAETLLFEDSRRRFSCGVRELNAVHLCKRVKVLRRRI
jgi:hypothetical protein